ncbi:MAG: glycosyltransferase, partial [bacterium]|nr:glycosyltransferase [bacterium]
FPFLLLGLRIIGKRVILELHQVILDINCLSGHTNLRKNGFLSAFFNFALKIFFTAISLLANRIIVLEEELKNRLSRFVNASKITTLFIAISEKESISKEEARKTLDLNPKDFIILNFGFINWYKGTDWIIKAVKDQKVNLIVAGGQSPTLKEKTHYQNFYQKIISTSETMSNVQVTGFVKDEDIPAYFVACDLVVLPYRAMMSSSGPLSLALSYQKPFILSSCLSGYFASADFRKSARLVDLAKEDLFFDLNYHTFKNKLKSLKITKLAKFSSNLAKMRSEKKLSRIYLKELTYVPNSNNRRRFLSILGKLFPRKLVVRVGQSAPRVLFGSQH